MHWREYIARYGRQWFPGEPWVRVTFLILFSLASLLRFWNFLSIPYTHDELSALVRIYPSLGETIQRGVIELDTHPPGVQIFEWLWTKMFGMNEPIVKLPFILLALSALFFLYRFALVWTSAPTALVVTALLATLQYTVIYAQIARPYAFGFFTMALLADQLTRYLALDSRRALVGIGIAIVLCAYSHHFTLMGAGIIALSGLFLVGQQQRKPYLIMCSIAMILYLPNVPIFLLQLGMGGLDGWLQPPGSDWLPTYGAWILHFSVTLGSVVGLTVILVFVLRIWRKASPTPAQWLLPVWGLAPLAIGYGYSVWRSPVLQYSMLIFSFPFILMALFAGLRNLGPRWTIVLCAIISLASTYSLVFERQHYTVFQGSRYEAMVRTAIQVTEENLDSTLVLFDAPEPQVRFYIDRFGPNGARLQYVQLRDRISTGQLDSILRAPNIRTVVLGLSNGAEPEDLARVQTHFPYVVEREDHLEGQVYVLSNDPLQERIKDRIMIAEAIPAHHWGGEWDIHDDLPIYHNGALRSTSWDLSGREYGVAVQVPFGPPMRLVDDFEAELVLEDAPNKTSISVVLELNVNDSVRFLRGGHLDTFEAADLVRLCTVASPAWATPGERPRYIAAFVANNAKASVRVQRLRLYQRIGQVDRNALFEPLCTSR